MKAIEAGAVETMDWDDAVDRFHETVKEEEAIRREREASPWAGRAIPKTLPASSPSWLPNGQLYHGGNPRHQRGGLFLLG